MRKDFLVFLFLGAAAAFVFFKSFFNFFAQDDFILISQFSGHGILGNLKNVFGYPTVTHWRPVHNIYFLLGETFFGKSYFFYHLLTLALHLLSGLLIYKVVRKITSNQKAALSSAFLYTTSQNHFVSLFWISGGATLIGFCFLIASFYSYLCQKDKLSVALFITSIFASEAMVVGVFIFLLRELFLTKQLRLRGALLTMILVSTVFSFARIVFLNPGNISESYRLQLSLNDLSALRYYIFRVLGFLEGGELGIVNLGVLIFLVLVLGSLATKFKSLNLKLLMFAGGVTVAGLFPFVLMPSHLSPHYLNISLFGVSVLVGIIISKLRNIVAIGVLGMFMLVSVLGVGTLAKNHWVVQRASLAKQYILKIESQNLPYGSKIVFEDTQTSTSRDAYIALGTGKAIRFWFGDKNYQTCFTFYENCVKN